MPALQDLSSAEAEAGQARYEVQLASRAIYEPAHKEPPMVVALSRGMFDKGTVRDSQVIPLNTTTDKNG